jgi:hypothetical protein
MNKDDVLKQLNSVQHYCHNAKNNSANYTYDSCPNRKKHLSSKSGQGQLNDLQMLKQMP